MLQNITMSDRLTKTVSSTSTYRGKRGGEKRVSLGICRGFFTFEVFGGEKLSGGVEYRIAHYLEGTPGMERELHTLPVPLAGDCRKPAREDPESAP